MLQYFTAGHAEYAKSLPSLLYKLEPIEQMTDQRPF